MRTQVHYLVRRFTQRTNKIRSSLNLPPTPTSAPSSPVSTRSPDSRQVNSNNRNYRHEGPNKFSLNTTAVTMFEADQPSKSKFNYLRWPTSFCGKSVLDPQGNIVNIHISFEFIKLWLSGKFYISWLCVVSMTFLYNAWVIPLRSSFPFQTASNTNQWIAIDICGDIIYCIDVIFVKHRIMYLYEGFWVRDKNLTRMNYMRKLQFKVILFK